jgi:hypothetical protein
MEPRTMRTTARRYALPAVLLVAAVALGLLAADVRAQRAALERGDVSYASTPNHARWHTSSRLPGNPATRLLAIDDDIRAREALRTFRTTAYRRGRLDNASDVAAARAGAEVRLATVARSRDAAKASQALTLLGVLAFGDFARSGSNSAGLAEASTSYFDAAVRRDPGNEAAKYDLELALKALAARGVRVGPGSGAGVGPTGRHGAGGGIPGHGY